MEMHKFLYGVALICFTISIGLWILDSLENPEPKYEIIPCVDEARNNIVGSECEKEIYSMYTQLGALFGLFTLIATMAGFINQLS